MTLLAVEINFSSFGNKFKKVEIGCILTLSFLNIVKINQYLHNVTKLGKFPLKSTAFSQPYLDLLFWKLIP